MTAGGCASMVAVGAMLSSTYVHDQVAGVASTFPEMSVARTWRVCCARSDGEVGRQRAGAPARGAVELALEGRGRLVAREREGRGCRPGRRRGPEQDLGLGRIALDDAPGVVGGDGVGELVRHVHAHVEGVRAVGDVAVALRRDAEGVRTGAGAVVERALVANVAAGRLEREGRAPVLRLRLRRAAQDRDGRSRASDVPRVLGRREVDAVADPGADGEVVRAEDEVRVGDAGGAGREDLVVDGRVERALEGRAGQVGREGERRGLVVRRQRRRVEQRRLGLRRDRPEPLGRSRVGAAGDVDRADEELVRAGRDVVEVVRRRAGAPERAVAVGERALEGRERVVRREGEVGELLDGGRGRPGLDRGLGRHHRPDMARGAGVEDAELVDRADEQLVLAEEQALDDLDRLAGAVRDRLAGDRVERALEVHRRLGRAQRLGEEREGRGRARVARGRPGLDRRRRDGGRASSPRPRTARGSRSRRRGHRRRRTGSRRPTRSRRGAAGGRRRRCRCTGCRA